MKSFDSVGMFVLVCTSCGGDGKCAECAGTGVNPHLNEDEPTCRNCSGSGECPGCEGTGRGQARPQGIEDLGLNSK